MESDPDKKPSPHTGETARHRQQPKIKVQAFLANLPLFSEMTPEELDRIAAGTETLQVSKGEEVCHRGDPVTGFHVVVYGQVKLGFTSPQGVEKVVEIVRPGQSFGEEPQKFLYPTTIFFTSIFFGSLFCCSAVQIRDFRRSHT